MVIQPHRFQLTVVVIWKIPFDGFIYLKIALKLQELFNLCTCWHSTSLHVLILNVNFLLNNFSQKDGCLVPSLAQSRYFLSQWQGKCNTCECRLYKICDLAE